MSKFHRDHILLLLQLALLLIVVISLSACGKIKVDVPTKIDVNHTISIDAETLERIEILCGENTATNEDNINCIDQLINAYSQGVKNE